MLNDRNIREADGVSEKWAAAVLDIRETGRKLERLFNDYDEARAQGMEIGLSLDASFPAPISAALRAPRTRDTPWTANRFQSSSPAVSLG